MISSRAAGVKKVMVEVEGFLGKGAEKPVGF